MDRFTLSGKDFCKLVELTCADKTISMIKVKGHGVSMTPFIKNGSTLTIRLLKEKDSIKVGDIGAVLNKSKENIIIHRIIGKKKDFYQIKGDNCSKDDGWFKKDRILGIVSRTQYESKEKIYDNSRYNLTIAFLSKTRVLNTIVLPLGRLIKNKWLNLER